jgi:hypothetical protein
VLQVLALVQRKGAELGGEAAELGRLAGEQEAALRSLIAAPPLTTEVSGATRREIDGRASVGTAREPTADLRGLLAAYGSADVSIAAPAHPVLLPAVAAHELAAAVGAALDNVRQHAGGGSRAWVLLEADESEITVSVRDDGVGFSSGRLAAAESEGRLGVASSIRGRLRDLGGVATVESTPGSGTEVELCLPRRALR